MLPLTKIWKNYLKNPIEPPQKVEEMRVKFYVMGYHKRTILFSFSDMSMSYRASVVKVPDYSSSSFSTEGFSVYKNTQSGK